MQLPKLINNFILAALSGILFAFSFYSSQLSVLAWISIIPFFASISGLKPADAFRAGIVFGTVANYAGQYWLVGTLTRFGGFPLPVSIAFILIYCLYLSFQYALFSYLCTRFRILAGKGMITALLTAAVWVSLEYLYPHLFPYGIGNSQGFTPHIIQIADISGVPLISFIIVLVNITLYRTYCYFNTGEPLPLKELSVSALVIACTLSYGQYRINQQDVRIAEAHKITAGIVQANFEFFEKSEENEKKVTRKHMEMSESISQADLIIWPETAVQNWLAVDADHYVVDGRAVVPRIDDTLFIIGGLSYEEPAGRMFRIQSNDYNRYNSAFLLDHEARVLGRYHKIELLMFGEYLPFANKFPRLRQLSPASGDFTPGEEIGLFESEIYNLKAGPLICYEDIIPSYSRELSLKGANLLVNLTNDAWFGRSIAPYQHLLVSVPRTIETRRYMIRSTNTGVSAFIDSAGRVIYKSEIFEDAAVKKEIALFGDAKTIYMKAGYMFPYACIFLSAVGLIFIKLRRKYIFQS